ncbi:MAG: helix-turn-helix domain-containing protein [Deltaproteobacteria bacterium]|nr:helix-turn-helix domain-containing protein [Deltaproteobacteria bacterium]
MQSPKILRVESLSKSKDGYAVLDHVNLDFRSGQICGIISDSRARLDTLIDIIAGAEREDSGAVWYGSSLLSPAERLKLVGAARERLALVDKLSVVDNVFLGSMGAYTRFGFLRKSAMRRRATEIFKRMELPVAPDMALEDIEPAVRILLDIARVLAKEPEYYVFDSVTRSMGVRQYEAFCGVAQDLKTKGKGVIVVPVNGEDIKSLVGRLFFLKGAQIYEIEAFKDMSDEELDDLFLFDERKLVKHINDPVYKARLWIDERAEASDIDFREIAESLFMSYDNFRRRFKQQVGLSPHRYFLMRKIERAKELLLFTDLEVKEVAERLGFSDPYYFSRVFKDWARLPPAKFRGTGSL